MLETSVLVNGLLGLIPMGYLICAFALAGSEPGAWVRMERVYGIIWAAAMLASTLMLAGMAQTHHIFNQSLVSAVVLMLVTFLGFILIHYSKNYMQGDANIQRFARLLSLTLVSVVIFVLSNHLVILFSAWVAISLGLHQLLLFYPQRRRAIIAAHKKFIFARMAEISLLTAFAILYANHHTLWISDILSTYTVDTSLSMSEQIAAVLIAIACLIKCAQLPLHGWLIQVVESPTPVSALLHAGVVNLGGYLLMSLAPLMINASIANYLLLVVAGLGSVVSALVMTTRVSIKVRLAWSTSAQMGLMLFECALGLYDLALLHLVAHSCYKAYSFLNSGSAVETHLVQKMVGDSVVKLPKLLAACVIPLLFLSLLFMMSPSGFSIENSSFWLLLLIASSTLLTYNINGISLKNVAARILMIAVLIAAYAIQKSFFHGFFAEGVVSSLAVAWSAMLFLLLIAGSWYLSLLPKNKITNALHRNLYAGFYLDEWATRITLALWPIKSDSK